MQEVQKHHSLFEVLQSVQRMFERYWNNTIWIKTEITKINYYPHSGHAYPLLVEKKSGKTIAEIRSTIWSSTYRRILAKFETVTKKEFTEGIEVLLLAEVKYTPAHGLSLNIIDVDPNYTLGAMERERLETIKKLKKENLFEENKKVKFPILPKRIAVISVETSKGYHDFIETLEKNRKNYKVEYELFPALLQGDKAIESIRRQLNVIRQRKDEFDVLAIIRGGGGEVGLNCYDSFSLASAVAQFSLPIITGIGHATNLTVVEMVSYKNLITPTALANFILEKFEDFDIRIENAESKLIYHSEKIIQDNFKGLQNLSSIFDSDVKLLLKEEDFTLEKIKSSISNIGKLLLNNKIKQINDLSLNIKYSVKEKIQSNNYKLEIVASGLKNKSIERVVKDFQKVENIESKISLLDPINVLKRGYTITRINGKSENISKVKEGDVLETETFNSIIKSRVEE